MATAKNTAGKTANKTFLPVVAGPLTTFGAWEPVRIRRNTVAPTPVTKKSGLVNGQRAGQGKSTLDGSMYADLAVLLADLELTESKVLRSGSKGNVLQLHGGTNPAAHIRLSIKNNGGISVMFKTHAGKGDQYVCYHKELVTSFDQLVGLAEFKKFYGL